MNRLFQALRRLFLSREDGSATIEFVMVFPPLVFFMLSSIELGMMSLHHSMLERAMDITVRDIRLGTGNAPQHDEIKTLICERAGFIANCDENLRLEMIQVNPRAWNGIAPDADCTDLSKEVAPVRNFVNGRENELMVLRACAKVNPLFPTTGLGKSMSKDGAGQYSIISMSAFVQEPR